MAKKMINPGEGGKGEHFYKEFMSILLDEQIPFIIGGTYALRFYTGIDRPTKDIDIFCKAGDYPRILNIFQQKGYQVEITDERWLAKIYKDHYFVDIIFGSIPALWPITDQWMMLATEGKILDLYVKVTPPEELVVSKAFRMDRGGFDGADVTNLILKKGNGFDWKRLLTHMEPYWEILFVHLILFRFIYPSERAIIPKWLMKELIHRISLQINLPTSLEKVCRGSLLSHNQFNIAYEKWGYNNFT